MHGLLNLHKPAGVTSRDVVNQIQRLVTPAKVGHAGTLDPIATGVLVVCIGAATRLTEYVQRLPKSYLATFLLGRVSDTDDVEGSITEIADPPRPTLDEITAALPRFIGNIQQRPPAYSAIKVQGRRAYELARHGEMPSLAERPVVVHSLRIAGYKYPDLALAIECGSGTYVRSLGRDLAESLGTGAVMNRLVRTAIGSFGIETAVDPNSLDAKSLLDILLPIESALQSLPAIQLTEEEVFRVRRGQFVSRLGHGFANHIAAFDSNRQLVAVLRPHDADQLRPEKVIGF
jgi:tRNA pseudouridine55 synthase